MKDTVQKRQFNSLTGSKRPQFNVRDNVMVRDYREKSDKRTSAKISVKSGPLSYTVQTGEKGNLRRHADQMVSTSVEPKPSEQILDISVDTSAEKEISTNSGAQPEIVERRYPIRNRKPPDRLTYQ